MPRIWALFGAAVLIAAGMLAGCGQSNRSGGGEKQIILKPEDLRWAGNEGMHGLQTAPLAGAAKQGIPYAERIRLPANTKLKPHSHPNAARMVTVMSGTFYFAFGDTFDEAKLQALPAGSFFTEPANVPHYAMTKEEVVLQLNAIGPAGTDYIQPMP